MEIKTALDLRMLLARYDVRPGEVAERLGMTRQQMYVLFHGREPIPDVRRIQFEEVAREFAANPPAPHKCRPRGPQAPRTRRTTGEAHG